MISLTFVVAALAASVSAASIAERAMVVHESRSHIPAEFASNGPAYGSAPLKLRLALAQSNMDALHKTLMDVSTPGNEKYGQHLSREEVFEYTRPSSDSVDAVQSWLEENGLKSTSISPAGDWISISTTVEQANRLFAADFHNYTRIDSGESAIRTMSYSIPSSLKGHLDLVHPTISFPRQRTSLPIASIPLKSFAAADGSAPASCNSQITPSCLQQLYGIPTTPATQQKNQLAVSGYIEQYANQADLRTFLTKLRPDISSNTTFTLQTLDGGQNSQDPSQAGIEADLDIQYTVGIATGVPTVFISVGEQFNDGDLDGFLDIINFLSGESTVPTVLTTSYGQNEADISRPLAQKLCSAIASIGTRGTSVLFASGDGGVGGSRNDDTCRKFVPTFPAGCPFLTAVGATQNVNPEVGAALSSGGFSNYFSAPDYQASAKSAFLKTLGNTYAGKFNASGRGYPDVSAIGEKVVIVQSGQGELVAGTSCSSPIFASVVALLNDELIAAGKSPLGFLNPWLYGKAASALNDITSGSNPGCGTNGFSAVEGWDPITGLGSPNYAKLRAAAGL